MHRTASWVHALALAVILTVVAGSPRAASAFVSIDLVQVGNPGNAADTASNCLNSPANCGSVAYTYFISEYDITNAQYAEFLNAVDPNGSNTLALWNTYMSSDPTFGGISLVSGNASGSKYVVNPEFANAPVLYTTFYDTLRFTNWLNNAQGSGDTEKGAYTLLGGTPTPTNGFTVTRNAGAMIFLPSENEWYKAAYYDPISGTYFAYPAGTSTPTVCAAPTATPNCANCGGIVGERTNVGAYTGSASPYGTYDQGGNVYQWNEEIIGANRGIRGGSEGGDASFLAASSPQFFVPAFEINSVGFRVASLVATPPPQVCGDGVIEGNEQCDDGNAVSGDGCSSTCQVELGWTCNEDSPSNCTTSLVPDGIEMVDTSTNLDWLLFVATQGESYVQVLSSWYVANEGFVPATVAQICTLTTDPVGCTATPTSAYPPKGGAAALLTWNSTALQGITRLSNPDGSQSVSSFTTQVNVTSLTPASSEINQGASSPTVAGFLVRPHVVPPPGCGLGPELALAAPLLLWLRSRRRRVAR